MTLSVCSAAIFNPSASLESPPPVPPSGSRRIDQPRGGSAKFPEFLQLQPLSGARIARDKRNGSLHLDAECPFDCLRSEDEREGITEYVLKRLKRARKKRRKAAREMAVASSVTLTRETHCLCLC